MTRKQEFFFLFTVSAVVSTVLFVGIMAWGWPAWLIFAVPWVAFPPLMVVVERFSKDPPASANEALRERRQHRPAGTH